MTRINFVNPEFKFRRKKRSRDTFTKMIMDVAASIISKWRSEGKSLSEIRKRFESIDFTNFYTKGLEIMTNTLVQGMKSHMYEYIFDVRCDEKEFLIHQEHKWGKCFVAFDSMYFIALEAANNYGIHLSSLSPNKLSSIKYTLLAFREMHARACQIFAEISCLIKNGFADGAFARWRCMYELCVLANFIRKYGDDVAKSFHDAADSDDSQYNWAKSASCFLGKKRVTFSDIENECDYPTDIWRAQYQLANKVVHASPQGTYKRLAVHHATGVLMAGRSDYGITTPAEHAAISLANISVLYFTIKSNGDSLVASKCLVQWIDIIRESFFAASDRTPSFLLHLRPPDISGRLSISLTYRLIFSFASTSLVLSAFFHSKNTKQGILPFVLRQLLSAGRCYIKKQSSCRIIIC